MSPPHGEKPKHVTRPHNEATEAQWNNYPSIHTHEYDVGDEDTENPDALHRSRSNWRKLLSKKKTTVAGPQDAHHPLHVQNPPVEMLSWSEADALVDDHASTAEKIMWRVSCAAFRSAVAARALHRLCTMKTKPSDASIFGNDIDKLVASGFLVKFRLGVQASVRFFTVLEFDKASHGLRRRVIAWPEAMNTAERRVLDYLYSTLGKVPHFFTAAEIRDAGVKHRFAASLDFTKFFQQFCLNRSAAAWWAVNLLGQSYRLSTVPTGAVFPPIIAQLLSTVLLRVAAANEPVHYDCTIDNLRLMSDDLSSLWRAWKRLLGMCKTLNITIGEANPPPTNTHLVSPYTYLGMEFGQDTTGPYCALSRRSVAKMRSIVCDGELNADTPKPAVDFLRIFGSTLWASTVTHYPLGVLYYIIKFIRRVCHKITKAHGDLSIEMTLWPAILNTWTSAIETLCCAKYRRAPTPTCTATLYTDASDDGWGVVVVDHPSSHLLTRGGPWTQSERSQSINLRELRALRIGVRILCAMHQAYQNEMPPNSTLGVTIYVDNTTALAWFNNGRAKQFAPNALAMEINALLVLNNIALREVAYIPSARNLADAPSRAPHTFTEDNSTTQLPRQ